MNEDIETAITPVIYELVSTNDPILHTPTIPFDFKNPPVGLSGIQLFQNLKATMLAKGNALGLSANQVGIPYSCFVYGNIREPDTISGVFNPKIVFEEGENLGIEGCLSYPGLVLNVKRAYTIRVRYTTHNGVTDTVKLTNLTARVFQHEINHLEGKTFGQDLSKFQLRRAIEKCNKKTGKNYKVADFYPAGNIT